MAYGLKYTTGTITREGVTYELRILQRDYSGSTLEIGDLQALSIEVQGASVGIDAPIVKTLLHFTVADTSDMGTSGGVKHGGWEEFYTPDATLYMVRLARNNVIMWSGFITPDSWSDGLVYRGSVTITARDNVGHMKDYEFSKAELLNWMSYLGGTSVARVRDDNLVSIYELVFAAFQVAGVDMPLRQNWDSGLANAEPHLMAGTYDVLNWLIDIDSLLEMDWYEAVEKVLASAGLALRWCGGDGICLMSLRALHKMGGATPPTFAANFVNRSGHRTLDPAYKQIVERLDYECTDGFDAKWAANDFAVTQTTIDGMVRYVSDLTLASTWTQYNSNREVLRYADPTQRGMSDIAGEAEKYVLVAGRPTTAPTPAVGPSDAYAKRISYIDLNNYVTSPGKRLSTNTIVTVGFDVAHSYRNAGSSFSFDYLSSFLPCGAIRYALCWKKADGTYLSLQDSEWVEGIAIREVAVPAGEPNPLGGVDEGSLEALSVSDTFQTPDVPGSLELRLYPVRIDMDGLVYGDDWLDAHVRVGNITFDINSEAVPRYFKTTTVYDEVQNYTLKRNVDFGAVPTRYQTAGTIRNGFYKPDKNNGYPSIMNCKWNGSNTELPLPVLNHLQILSLHAKANNVLTGELRAADGTPITWNGNWTYGGRNFLLISGIWNILTGRVQDAMLREFDTYATAIGDAQADYTTDLSGGDARLMALQKSVNAAASMARSGGGGGGGTGSVTSVGLSMPSNDFSVTNSPVTSSGTLTVNWVSKTKNYVLAGPSTANGTPSFRALVEGDIPNLAASKITSGTFDAARIPSLAASKITSGTFDTARIPDLAASKITSGTFDTARIPDLAATKITSGTFDVARIPDLSATKITSGVLDEDRIPDLSDIYLSYKGFVWGDALNANNDLLGSWLTNEQASNLPQNYGVLVAFGSGTTSDSYGPAQLMIDENSVPYFRIKWNGNWTDWQEGVLCGRTQTISGAKTFTSPVTIGSTGGLSVDGAAYIDIGEVRLVYDSYNNALRVKNRLTNGTAMGFYADGFVAAGGVGSSGGGGGATSLSGLSDVNSNLSPSAGNFLWYNNSSHLWDAHALTYSDITDLPGVSTTTGYLKYTYENGSGYWSLAPTAGASYLSQLLDVNVEETYMYDGFVLTYDHSSGNYILTSKGGGGSGYTLPPATSYSLGGIKVGSGLSINSSGVLSVTGTPGSLSPATASSLGGIKVGSVISTPTINSISSTAGRYYYVQADSNGLAFVNIPWVSGSGGGSTVSVTQVVSSGTKIATITVDGSPTDLYAPSSGGGGGSTVTWGSQSTYYAPLTVDGVLKNVLIGTDYVSLSGTQTITGAKTFSTNPVTIGSTSSLSIDQSSYIDLGPIRIKFENDAVHITKKDSSDTKQYGLYADGFIAAGGVA